MLTPALVIDLDAVDHNVCAFLAYARAHGAPLRHAMLCGAPGTGKTLVAKRMAQQSGLDYAIMRSVSNESHSQTEKR